MSTQRYKGYKFKHITKDGHEIITMTLPAMPGAATSDIQETGLNAFQAITMYLFTGCRLTLDANGYTELAMQLNEIAEEILVGLELYKQSTN